LEETSGTERNLPFVHESNYFLDILTYLNMWCILSAGVIDMELDAKRTALLFKAFCDENRVRILQLLSTGEKCACKLLEELPVSQPTLSHHMKILCDSGIVQGRKEGKWMHYSLSEEGCKYGLACFLELTKLDNTAESCDCCRK
jgi:DNA-binding transcriptional ArsR family regulator